MAAELPKFIWQSLQLSREVGIDEVGADTCGLGTGVDSLSRASGALSSPLTASLTDDVVAVLARE